MGNTLVSCGCHMGITWITIGVTWVSHGGVPWMSHRFYMSHWYGITWVTHGYQLMSHVCHIGTISHWYDIAVTGYQFVSWKLDKETLIIIFK